MRKIYRLKSYSNKRGESEREGANFPSCHFLLSNINFHQVYLEIASQWLTRQKSSPNYSTRLSTFQNHKILTAFVAKCSAHIFLLKVYHSSSRLSILFHKVLEFLTLIKTQRSKYGCMQIQCLQFLSLHKLALGFGQRTHASLV